MLKSSRMNILLTNDDGYNHPGLAILKEVLKKYGNVYVVAPFEHQSGKSMCFSLNKGFTVRKHSENTYSIDGTPVDCVLLAVQILDVKFDLVVSGANDGHNISYDCLYSGTVGAAIEGLNHEIPSIAISTDFDHFDIVKKEVEKVLNYIFEHKLIDKRYCLNVNFPLKEFAQSKGIKLTREHMKKDQFYTWKVGELIYTDRNQDLECDEEDTDVYAVTHGYVSICPITNSWFHNKTYQEISKKV